MKKSIILSGAFLLCFGKCLYASDSSELNKLLVKYAVPSSSLYCGRNRAFYDETTQKATCQECGMFYDTSIRACQDCPKGTFVNNRYSTKCAYPSCDVGQYAEMEEKENCPVGFYKFNPSTCI